MDVLIVFHVTCDRPNSDAALSIERLEKLRRLSLGKRDFKIKKESKTRISLVHKNVFFADKRTTTNAAKMRREAASAE
jgi:hypothetical protein